MKARYTARELKNQFGDKMYKIGYCYAQNLLNYENPFGYTHGVYGWNADFYAINDIVISTGYRPVGIPTDHYIVQKYDEMAFENNLAHNRSEISFEECKEKNRALIAAMIDEMKELN